MIYFLKKLIVNLLVLLLIIFLPLFSSAETWVQTSDVDFTEGIFNATQISGNGVNASLSLVTDNQTDFGNYFIFAGWSHQYLNNVSYFSSVRFTILKTQTIDKIIIPILSIGAASSYELGIQRSDINGNPDGVFLSKGIFTTSGINNNYEWPEVDIPNLNVTTGEVLHIVCKPFADVDVNNYARIIFGYDSTQLNPYECVSDTNSACFRVLNAGDPWTFYNYQPVYILKSTLGEYEGNSYDYPYTNINIYGDTYAGEEFTITGESKTVNKVRFYIAGNSTSSPADDLYVILENVTDGITLESGKVLDKSGIMTMFSWYTYNFSASYNLELGKKYRLYLKSPSSSSSSYYYVRRMRPYYPNEASIGAAQIATTYKGGDYYCISSNNAGSSWNNYYKGSDILFRLSFGSYTPSGTYISSIVDSKGASTFNTVSWEPLNQAPGTGLNLQIASSNNSSGPWLYFGPDGTENSYYINAVGENISPLHNGKRYMRYIAYFDTTNISYSPLINKLTIDYMTRYMTQTKLEFYNYPNPFQAGKESTTIKYILTKDSNVTIRIYSLLGGLVKEMSFVAGSIGGTGNDLGYDNEINWDGRNSSGMIVANGVYICQIIAKPADGSSTTKETRKIAVVK